MKNTSYPTFWSYLQIFGKKFKPYIFILKKKEGGR